MLGWLKLFGLGMQVGQTLLPQWCGAASFFNHWLLRLQRKSKLGLKFAGGIKLAWDVSKVHSNGIWVFFFIIILFYLNYIYCN